MANDELISEKLSTAITAVKGELKKLRKKLSKQIVERDEAGDWETVSHWADTLLANRAEVKKGMKEILLENVHTGEPEIIKLNPKCTVDKNAELFYKKARRGKRGYDTCLEKVEATENEMAFREEQLQELLEFRENGVEGRELLFEKRLEEIASGNTKPTQNQSRAKDEKKHPFRHYTYKGYDIFAGRTSTDNDQLSTRFAKPSDVWFHAVGYAGSHVIIRRKKNDPWPPEEIINIAGGISVFFSKAKNTSYAEVHVTEARFVRKPRHAPAGLVTAERCKTIKMNPIDPQKLFRDEK